MILTTQNRREISGTSPIQRNRGERPREGREEDEIEKERKRRETRQRRQNSQSGIRRTRYGRKERAAMSARALSSLGDLRQQIAATTILRKMREPGICSPPQSYGMQNTPLDTLRYERFAGTFNKTLPPELGMYATFGLLASDCTIALLASIRRSVTNASPALFSAEDITAAASASPSARITAACRSCSA